MALNRCVRPRFTSLIEMEALPEILFYEFVQILHTNDIRLKQNFERAMEPQGFTIRQVVEECNVLKRFAHQGILRQLVVEAHAKRVISDITDWDVKDGIDLARWCESKDGKDIIAAIAEKEEMWKRGFLFVSPYRNMLDVQLTELNEEISSKTTETENEISQLTRNIEEIKIRHKEDTKNVYGYAGHYKPPNTEQVTRQCWERYLQEHEYAGLPLYTYNDITALAAVQRYRKSVLEDHKTIFCSDNLVRDDLERYLKQKICDSVSNPALAEKYKSMLLDTGRKMAEEDAE